MAYGYTIHNSYDADMFYNAVHMMHHVFKYHKDGEMLEDVDGTLIQRFTNESGQHSRVVCDTQIDYVAVISDIPLDLEYLYKWNC